MNEKIRIALLGVSHWHLPLYLPGLPCNSVVGISDENLSIANHYADIYHCSSYLDYKHMILETKPDFVFAFAPHYRMKEVADYLLESGIAFSIEKPAGINSKEIESIYEKSENTNGFCSIPFVWRYSDTVNNLKNIYLKSPIVHMSYRFIAGPPSRYLSTSPWMLSFQQAGGGCMTNLGVHFIDMAMFLTDTTNMDILASAYQYGHKYDIETYASSLLKLENGATMTLETGYAFPMDDKAKRENRWTIVTENGFYVLADNQLEIREYNADTNHILLNTDSDVYYAEYSRITLRDYIGGIKPRSSLKEMLNVSRILDQMNSIARKHNQSIHHN